MRLPKKHLDLRLYALFREITRWLLYALWIAFWLLGALFYNQSQPHLPPARLLVGWKLWVWMGASLLLGFLIFRIWRSFTNRGCQGRVLQSSLSHSYESSRDPGMLRTADYDFRLNTLLKLETPKGRRVRLRFEQKNGFYLYYHEGEELLRLYGLPYPVNLNPSAPHGYLCVACGRIHETLIDRCEDCGHTLLDPQELLEIQNKKSNPDRSRP